MSKSICALFGLCLLISSCNLDDEPKASCIDPDIFELPSFATVISQDTVMSAEDSGTYWVCNGGNLTLSGTDNLILVDSGGVVIIEGVKNEAFNLGGGTLRLPGGENEVWLNGESKTFVTGFENQLYYYRIGELNERGEGTYIDELCANVEVDYRLAPPEGCQ